MGRIIRIGTRKSPLALAQTMIVRDRLVEANPGLEVEIKKIDTRGDQILDRSLTSFGGKGVFTAELEQELLGGQIDFAVHSAKDMPMDFPEGLGIGAVLDRGDPRDTFVTTSGRKLKDLPAGSIVGTSSLRRELLIREINPHVQIRLLRGNVHTRLRKLKEGDYDGIIMAAAGIERSGLTREEGIFVEYLDPKVFLPAAGQGILAVESRMDDEETRAILDRIHSDQAGMILHAERTFLKTIGGGCNAPAAGYALCEEGGLAMHVMYAADGKNLKKASRFLPLDGEDPMETAGKAGEEAAFAVNPGKVWLTGAGPGDEDLITKKAWNLLKEADVVVYDSLAPDSLLNIVRDDAELIYAGKRSSHHHLKQYETNDLLVHLARQGKKVVRLKGGDPFIFGRGGEEGQELREAGVEFEIVPGVSSSSAVPAYNGIPVTHRDHASSFHVITGHEGDHKNGCNVLDYETLAKEEGTLIFLMGLKNLPNIVRELIRHGKDPQTPAAVLQEGTTARQKKAVACLKDIVKVSEEAGIKTPAITVVGDVVSLNEELDWFGHRPLSGKRVLVTGSPSFVDKLSPLLKEEGAQAVSLSLIRTEAIGQEVLEKTIEKIDSYSWIVFTSANGVRIFFDQMKNLRKDIRSLGRCRFAVIGSGTKKALENIGIYSDFLPDSYSSEDMAKALLPLLKKEDKVLLLRAQEASEVLPEALTKAGIPFENVAIYHTVRDYRKEEILCRIAKDADYITFASSSAVKAYVSMMEDVNEFKGKYVSIGPVTSKTMSEAGLNTDIAAGSYTAQGMVEAMIADVKKDENTD